MDCLNRGGYDSIMVVVDQLSKFDHFIVLKHLVTTKQVVDVFIDKVVSKHEIPKSIITERDKIFLSSYFKGVVL